SDELAEGCEWSDPLDTGVLARSAPDRGHQLVCTEEDDEDPGDSEERALVLLDQGSKQRSGEGRDEAVHSIDDGDACCGCGGHAEAVDQPLAQEQRPDRAERHRNAESGGYPRAGGEQDLFHNPFRSTLLNCPEHENGPPSRLEMAAR